MAKPYSLIVVCRQKQQQLKHPTRLIPTSIIRELMQDYKITPDSLYLNFTVQTEHAWC